jgi:hypothetical protein
VVEVVPEVPVVQEAAFMPVTVATDAPRQLPEHVFSMPAVVVVVTTAATQLLITEQIPDPPVTEARVVVEMEDSPPAMPLLKQLRPVQAQPTLVVVVVVPVNLDHLSHAVALVVRVLSFFPTVLNCKSLEQQPLREQGATSLSPFR